MDWEKLAEARIQEWQARPAAERMSAPAGPVAPLEMQLLSEVLRLRALAEASPEDAERRLLAQRAHDAETRLMVLLESSGRPLAARRIAALLSGGAPPGSL